MQGRLDQHVSGVLTVSQLRQIGESALKRQRDRSCHFPAKEKIALSLALLEDETVKATMCQVWHWVFKEPYTPSANVLIDAFRQVHQLSSEISFRNG